MIKFKNIKILLSDLLSKFIARAIFPFLLLLIAVQGIRLLVGNNNSTFIKILGFLLIFIILIVGLFFSYLMLTDKLRNLSKFWKDAVLYNVYFKSSSDGNQGWYSLFKKYYRLFKGLLVLITTLALIVYLLISLKLS